MCVLLETRSRPSHLQILEQNPLHIWHLRRIAREVEITRYENIQEDARVNLLLLEDDLNNARNLVRHGLSTFLVANAKKGDGNRRAPYESDLSQRPLTAYVSINERHHSPSHATKDNSPTVSPPADRIQQ